MHWKFTHYFSTVYFMTRLWYLKVLFIQVSPVQQIIQILQFSFYFPSYHLWMVWMLINTATVTETKAIQFCCSLFSSVQSLSYVWLCNLMDCRMPGFSVHHQLPEVTQTHVHWVSDAIQSSHPLLSPFSSLECIYLGIVICILEFTEYLFWW